MDHVFVGECDGALEPDGDEAEDTEFVHVGQLKRDVRDRPERYTPLFKISLGRVLQPHCAEGCPPEPAPAILRRGRE